MADYTPKVCWNCGGNTFHKTIHKGYDRFICVRKSCGKGQSVRVKHVRQIDATNNATGGNPYASSNVGRWSY